MQCFKVFIIPNFINIIFCFGFLLCGTVIEVCASWVWSFMLRNPFFIKHYLVILQQIQCSKVLFIPNFIIVIFCYWLFTMLYCEVCASWVWSFMLRNPFFIRHCLVILQQMQCSKVFFIPNFIIVIFCYWLFAVLYCDWGICQLGMRVENMLH